MKNIKYKIEFFTDWHCGAGLAAGADMDATVIKDKKGLPFVPGKTIKGLLREAVETLSDPNDDIKEAFGFNPDELTKADTDFMDKIGKSKGTMFFQNASLPTNEQDYIIQNKLSAHLYRAVASTAIGDNGIAEDHSLRKIEVTVPCIIYGEILDVPDAIYNDIENGMKFIKRLGVNRNRGLGRCKFSVI
jgi:CRISPR/Cas system CSM-associated protein Csm3 (group 7 of RAMP superfamily)